MDSISVHDDYASTYEAEADKLNYTGPELLFGLCHSYLKPGQNMLDLGIGTGLCAEPFTRFGLTVHGMDGAPAMMEICKQKNRASEFTQWNLAEFPYPMEDEQFDHVMCCGVLHFFEDISGIITECARLVKPGGSVSLMVLRGHRDHGEPDENVVLHSTTPISFWQHRLEHVSALGRDKGLALRKSAYYLMEDGGEPSEELVFTLAVLQKV